MRVGIDAVEVRRFAKLSPEKQNAFCRRCLTEREHRYVRAKGVQASQTLAGIFAAKEAVLKALGIGIGGGIALSEVEILHEETGRPVVHLCGDNPAALQKIEISISHTEDVAYAVAVLQE